MPEWPQGVAFFPGCEAIEAAQFTLSHGITPSVALLTLSPQRDLATRDGTLTFTFGNLRLDFPDCRVDQQSLQRDPQTGEVWSLSLFDRRWKWAFAGPRGPLSGWYNWLGEDGRPENDYKKKPQELARLCLDAMGERDYDVSQMPNDFYPEVKWDNMVPAQALADLAQRCGCRIVLTLANTVRVCQTGVGALLPLDEATISDSLTINPPERPDSLRAVCAVWFENYFLTEAVGLDTDGTIVPIDELSYKPVGGWGKEIVGFFYGVAAGEERELARRTVYRWYRIRVDEGMDGSKPMKLPGYPGKVTHLRQILPDVWSQTSTVENERTKEVTALPAEVLGTYWTGGYKRENTPDRTPYTKPFSFDADRGIIKFDRAVVRYTGPAGNRVHTAAWILLLASVQVKHEITFEQVRYVRELAYPPPYLGTGPRIVPASEVYAWYRPEYDFVTGKVTKVTDNLKELNEELDHRLRAVDQEYQATLPQEIGYDGLKAIDLDGAIQQVTWSVSTETEATTRASRNDEFDPNVPNYEERRVRERIRADEVNELKRVAWKLKEEAGRRKQKGFGQ